MNVLSLATRAQSIVGFWHVTNVMVGEENMTPVAKWFEFAEDGTATGGNGWTQNSIGKWTYNAEKREFSATNDLGIKDDFGPFKISFSSDTMKWVRMEEGMNVVVSLIPAQTWAPAPIDLVKGLWSLIKVEDLNGKELTDYDPQGMQFLFLRPDMRFRIREPDGNILQGFWHMHGHRPLLTLINYDRTISNEEYTVSIDEESLTMKSINDQGYLYKYLRIHEFPE